MSNVVQRRKVDDAFFEMLSDVLPFPVGMVDPPALPQSQDPNEVKYAVITPVSGAGEQIGPPTHPESDVILEYDVTSVGLAREQASWVSDMVRSVIVGRNAHGALTKPLTIPEHYEDDRWQVGPIGSPVLDSGLYQVVDSYQMKVSRT